MERGEELLKGREGGGGTEAGEGRREKGDNGKKMGGGEEWGKREGK